MSMRRSEYLDCQKERSEYPATFFSFKHWINMDMFILQDFAHEIETKKKKDAKVELKTCCQEVYAS